MIFDCFTFFDELDILDIRLNVLNEVVDKFVLVESTLTHSGHNKSLYFDINKEKFSPFLNKIIHVVVDDMDIINGVWEKENYQRNQIMRGLVNNANDEDCILISDIDEIPNSKLIKNINPEKNKIIGFKQRLFYYYLNCEQIGTSWIGTKALKFGTQKLVTPQYVRNYNNPDLLIIEKGGGGIFPI